MSREKQKKKTGKLDTILSVICVCMLIATMVLDELDKRKKPPVSFPEIDPDETREEIREEMQKQYET